MNHPLPDPVIVLSPCVRAGTTLVQRLLCSAPNTLIYGDMVGQEVEFFVKYAQIKEQVLKIQESHTAPMREGVLAGGTDDFLATLCPKVETYAGGFRQAALIWLAGCAAEAREAGRSVWGWKLAGADPQVLPGLAAWLPGARWIWVDRPVRDCFRSAKAAGQVSGPADAAVFAARAATVQAVAGRLARPVLKLNYEFMLADPAGTVRLLEAHTGAEGIDSSVFQRRINQPGRTTPVPPAELTPVEEQALLAGAPQTTAIHSPVFAA